MLIREILMTTLNLAFVTGNRIPSWNLPVHSFACFRFFQTFSYFSFFFFHHFHLIFVLTHTLSELSDSLQKEKLFCTRNTLDQYLATTFQILHTMKHPSLYCYRWESPNTLLLDPDPLKSVKIHEWKCHIGKWFRQFSPTKEHSHSDKVQPQQPVCPF